jgi:hypothetical protein
MSRAVSTAEKRAQLEAAGEPWPLYPDGTKQRWIRNAELKAGGRWGSFIWVQYAREYSRKHDRKYREANPEKYREYRRKWGEKNAEYNREYRAQPHVKAEQALKALYRIRIPS